MTTDGRLHNLFLDGTLVGTQEGTTFHERSVRNYVGAGTTGSWEKAPPGTSYFNGLIDEVAIYHKTLEPATVASHAQLGALNANEYRARVEDAGPVGYWSMAPMTNGIARNLVTPPNSDVAGVWNVQYGAESAFGRDGDAAMGFDGTSSHLRLRPGQLPAGQQFIVETWFKTDAPGVLMGYATEDFAYVTPDTPGTPMLYVGTDRHLRAEAWHGSPTPIASTETVMDNQWHHVAFVVDTASNKQTLYVDGRPVGTKDTAFAVVDQHLTIGAGLMNGQPWPAAPSNFRGYFRGTIDEVALYRQVLTPESISAHYAAGTTQTNSRLASSVTVTDPGGNVAKRTYDALRGRLLSSTNAGGATTSYGYDAGGYQHSITDPNGNTVISGHDARGNEVSRTTCRSTSSCWTGYQEFYLNAADELDPRNDQLIVTKDPRSADARDNTYRTQYTYTTLGEPETVVNPDGSQTVRAYTVATTPAEGGGVVPAGLLRTLVEPGNRTTTYSYYANGDLAAITEPSGLVTRYAYDGIGRKTVETVHSDSVPGGVPTVFTYDGSSRVLTATGPGVANTITDVVHTGRTTRTYDADGRVLTTTESDLTGGDASRTTTTVYDQRGLPTSVTDAEGNVTGFAYDAFGRPERETAATGDVTRFTYTPAGQLAETILLGWTGDPLGSPPHDLVLESRAYDPAGRLASVTDSMGGTTVFQYYDDDRLAKTVAKGVQDGQGVRRDLVLERNWYDGAGNLVRTTTGNGTQTTEIKHDSMGRVVESILDPGGLHRITTHTYNAAGDRTQSLRTGPGITHPEVVDVEYDALGRPLKETVRNDDGTGRVDTSLVTTVTYDQRGLVTSTKSPNANAASCTGVCEVSMTYDILGRLVRTEGAEVPVSAGGQPSAMVRPTTSVGYNVFGEAVQSRDANGNVTTTQVDKLGRPTATTMPNYTPPGATSPLPATRSQTYDKLGRPITATDALGRTTTMKYDQLGNLVEQIAPGPDAPKTTFRYTPTGLQLSATGPSGERTEATYDQLGRPLTTSRQERYPDPKWFVMDYAYDDASNLVRTSSPLGRETRTRYNVAGQVVETIDPEGESTSIEYDGLGRPVRTTPNSGRATSVTYSPSGRVDAVHNHDHFGGIIRTTSQKYDHDGKVTRVDMPAGGQTSYSYDGSGRLITQIEKLSATDSITTAFEYDAAGNRTRFVDGRGNATIYTYNSWGLNESTIEPSTAAHPNPADRTWTSVYDSAGQTVTQLAPGGVRNDMVYNPLGLIVGQSGSGAEVGTTTRSFTYDVSGRRLTAKSETPLLTRTDAYTYNDRGLMLTAEGPGGDAQYTWNAEDELVERTDEAGTRTFGYDGNGRLSWAQDPQSATTFSYWYDQAGRLGGEDYSATSPLAAAGVGTAQSEWPKGSRYYSYDELGRLVGDSIEGQDGVEQMSITYGYDDGDRVTSKTTTGVAGASANTYTYDLAGRLTSHNDGTTTTAYEWDAAGNRTKAGSTTATYDERNRLLTAGTTSYTYSPRGTRATTTVPGLIFTSKYDAFEQLLEDGNTTYEYDALGRVAKRDNDGSYRYDGATNNLVKAGDSRFARGPDGSLLSSRNGDPA